MRVRILVSVALLLVGVGLPVAAVVSNGPPWGFRDRAAVVLESVGSVEVYPSPERREREGLKTASIPGKPGLALRPGDEVRVGTVSELRARTPQGDVTLSDGAQARFLAAWLSFGRGMGVVEVAAGSEQRLRAEELALEVVLGPGRYRLAADGKVAFFLLVEEGKARVVEPAGVPSVTPQRMLRLVKGGAPEVLPIPTSLSLVARFDRATDRKDPTSVGFVRGRTEVGTQIYVDGKLSYPDPDGSFSVSVPPGERSVVVFARDPAGNVRRLTVARGE